MRSFSSLLLALGLCLLAACDTGGETSFDFVADTIPEGCIVDGKGAYCGCHKTTHRTEWSYEVGWTNYTETTFSVVPEDECKVGKSPGCEAAPDINGGGCIETVKYRAK